MIQESQTNLFKESGEINNAEELQQRYAQLWQELVIASSDPAISEEDIHLRDKFIVGTSEQREESKLRLQKLEESRENVLKKCNELKRELARIEQEAIKLKIVDIKAWTEQAKQLLQSASN